MSLISCTYNLFVLSHTIHDIIFYNSLFHFTQSSKIYTDFQMIYVINKLYVQSVCFQSYYSWYQFLQYACPVEIEKELAISHAPP